MKRKRKLVAMLLFPYRCIVTINVLWLLLTVPWVGLQGAIVIFPDQAHILFDNLNLKLVHMHIKFMKWVACKLALLN